MASFFRSPVLLFPAMISLGVLVLGMRVADVWHVASSGKLIIHNTEAQAQTKAEAATPPAAAPSTTESSPPRIDVPPASGDLSPAEVEVLKQLSERRDKLEQHARELDNREQLIKVAEQRVDQKIHEMENLRVQLQSMVNQASEAQAAQIENLVKIYETMKPEEAARIFETLDMPILLGVFQKMKPARTAPIMAKMTPEKAKEITISLSRKDQLPQLK